MREAGRRGVAHRRSRRLATAVAAAAVAATASGCIARTPAGTFFQLTEESAAQRAMQTREVEAPNADELLSASAAVLQDLGFQVTESERALGFLKAAKERSAREYWQEFVRGFLLVVSALGSNNQNNVQIIPVDLHQQINASLVALPVDDGGRRHRVRIVFYRLVWQSEGQNGNTNIPPGRQKMEMIHDAGIYQQFFARLAKSVFLEEQKI